MQINVPGGGVDTVSDQNPQILGFESPGYLILLYPFFSNSTGQDLHDVIVRFRKSPLGYATRDSRLAFFKSSFKRAVEIVFIYFRELQKM